MKSNNPPNPPDLLKGLANYEANVYAAFWTAFRVCYRLREKGLFDDEDIHAIFDLKIAQQLAPPSLQSEVLTKIQNMRDQCLAQSSQNGPPMTH